MVRTTLINLVNERIKDRYWWFNGRNLTPFLIKFENKRLSQIKAKEEKAKHVDAMPILDHLVNQIKSTDSDQTKTICSIKNLEDYYMRKFDEKTSKKLVREQLKLIQNHFAVNPE